MQMLHARASSTSPSPPTNGCCGSSASTASLSPVVRDSSAESAASARGSTSPPAVRGMRESSA